MENEFVEQYDENQIKQFFKACEGHKYECYYKMIFAYRLSRLELMNMKWSDIDFVRNAITIHHISRNGIDDYHAYYTHLKRDEEFARTYPLLPHIKDLLINEQQKQLQNSISCTDYDFSNRDYLCVRENGKMMNARTLSRNIKYITRDNNLPECLITGIKDSANEYLFIRAENPNLFRCWTRFDFNIRRQNIYEDYNLFRNRKFQKLLNSMIDQSSSRQRKEQSEM